MRYRRVDMIDRCDIQSLKEEGKNQREIAEYLKLHPSTISRELRRKGAQRNGEYYYGWAQEAADDCLLHRRLPRKLKGERLKYALQKLDNRWSPSQIANRIKIDLNLSLSSETIYRFLKRDRDEGGELYKLLRRQRSRKHRFPTMKRQTRHDLLPSIEERGEIVERRDRFGDWERDTFFGASKRKAVLILLERKSRFIKLRKINLKTSETNLATEEMLKGLPAKSLTNDRGVEFLDYKKLNLKIPIYFCHPYTSQERGSVENAIGLIRQYLPKRFNIEDLTSEQLIKIERQLNERPRKSLDWKTPMEILGKEKVALCG